MAQSGWGRPRDDHFQIAAWLIAEQVWIQHHVVPQWATDLETRLNRKWKSIMGAVQDAVDAVAVQLGKAKDEILAKVADLEAAVAAGETPNLEPLKAAAQALDDVVPDTVEEPPVQ